MCRQILLKPDVGQNSVQMAMNEKIFKNEVMRTNDTFLKTKRVVLPFRMFLKVQKSN